MTQRQPKVQPAKSSTLLSRLVEKGLSTVQANGYKALITLVLVVASPFFLRLSDELSQSSSQATAPTKSFETEAFSRMTPATTTLLEAQVLLGPGVEMSSSVSTALYRWEGPNGTYIFGEFKNNAIVRKF